jgi:hypothetical protein
LVLELSKGPDRFQARWDLASGSVTLVRKQNLKEEELGQTGSALKKPGKYHLRFANFDRRLTLWVDSALPFGDGRDYEAPRVRHGDDQRIIYGPNEENDLEPASIGVQGAGVSVQQLKLWRNTYYTNPSDSTQALTLYVQPNHYLCLGDNSPQSSDSRSWGENPYSDQRGGLVPKALMLGRALWVYYPFPPFGGRFGPIE